MLILFYSMATNVHRYAIPILPLYWAYAALFEKHKSIGQVSLILMETILIIGTVFFATWALFW